MISTLARTKGQSAFFPNGPSAAQVSIKPCTLLHDFVTTVIRIPKFSSHKQLLSTDCSVGDFILHGLANFSLVLVDVSTVDMAITEPDRASYSVQGLAWRHFPGPDPDHRHVAAAVHPHHRLTFRRLRPAILTRK